MKKIKFFALLVFIITAICALALTANAKWWDENPFTDVKSTHWYYDAVRICNENELVKGMKDDTFAPSVKMTRAMLVQVLYNADGATDEFTGTPFTDVKSNHWYANAVEWAYENKITSGLSDTTFGAMSEITREQLAAMLYRYAEYKGMAIENQADISAFPDADKVSTWAVKNFEWAYGNSIISGSKKGDEVYLNPRNSATRAECAQMLSKYLYLNPTYTINGNDLSLYTIVYSAGEIENVADAANTLAQNIEYSLGISLPIVTDETAETEYEILVGRTNRSAEIDESLISEINQFMWTVDENKLVFMGTDSDSDRGTKEEPAYNMNGTELSVITFAEKVLGIEFYTAEKTVATPDPVISLEDGYCYVDDVDFIWRSLDIDGNGITATANYHEEWGCGLPHQIGNLMFGYWKEGRYDNVWPNPCYTDPDNVASLIQNVRELIELKPELTLIGLIQNDSQEYCRCETCGEAFRAAGSRNGALMQLINIVCETFEDEYPNLKFATWAYTWGIKPPIGIELHDNVIVYFNTLALDPSHPFNSTDCTYNKDVVTWLEGWSSLVDEMYLWEHSGAPLTPLTPCCNFDDIRTNVRLFADYGINGVFMNAISRGDEYGHSDFNEIRAYLYDHLYRDAYMSEEEYDYRLNSILKAVYGDGWLSLRAYIDGIGELGDNMCHPLYSSTMGYFNYAEVREHVDEFDRYFAEAKAKATEEQADHIGLAEVSWTYLKQCALYETEYTNGDGASRAAYIQDNEKLYEAIVKYDQLYEIEWSYNPEKNPQDW